MGNGHSFGGEEVKEESSWRYPLGIFIATLVLCAIFLYYYVGPNVDELSGNVPSPAISEEPVAFSIAGVSFSTPTNYTVYPKDRRGGDRDDVSLYALWPTLSGYTPARRDDFINDAPDTRRIDITISRRTSAFDEVERIDTLYLPQTTDDHGVRTPYQLVKYAFKDQRANVPTNGYADTELYLGTASDGRELALFCFDEKVSIKSPDCWRQYELGPDLSVTYRFKRPYLAEWKAIDTQVRALVERFRAKS
ncbi:MAG TPA: hypothetical protein VNH64_06945 [Parvularculaceae bacterium]|nr:hypothetical protein [Parvularculaceae bacterium]